MESLVILAIISVFIGGLTKGVTGFGYAVTGTAFLSSFIPAKTAIVLMLPALLASNIGIIWEADLPDLLVRLKGFRYFAISLIAGSVAGTLLVDYLPQLAIKRSIGVLILLYVIFQQEMISVGKISRFKEFCLKRSHKYQELLGLGAGIIFGSSNIGVPIVAIVQRIENNHKKFITLLSSLMVLSITSRFITAYATSLYSFESLKLALGLMIPGIIGLRSGEVLRSWTKEDSIKKLVMALLLAISLRLIFL